MTGQPLEIVKYRVLGKPYSKWRAIIAEMGESDTKFLMGLNQLHGIVIKKAEDPMLYVIQDTAQMAEFASAGVISPTLLQILLTSRSIALSEQGAIERFEKLMREDGE